MVPFQAEAENWPSAAPEPQQCDGNEIKLILKPNSHFDGERFEIGLPNLSRKRKIPLEFWQITSGSASMHTRDLDDYSKSL